MKFLKKMKDGGPESKVTGYWLIEAKSLFSIVLLHFSDGSREAYHNHAFNAISWVLSGQLNEEPLHNSSNTYTPSLRPVWTPRTMFHKVKSIGDTWVLSFRGPWKSTWNEFIPATGRKLTLTHGRREL
jgi:hypothetical protein